MALSIKDPEAARLAREVSEYTGETMTQAVIVALRERLAREQRKRQNVDSLIDEVMLIGKHFAALPVLDSRNLDEMLYDESGLPV